MASYLPNLSRDNISLYTIPAAWLIALMPRFYAASTYKASTGKSFNAVNPRLFVGECSSTQSLDSTTKGRILRAESAQQNSYENLGLFAAAIVAGNAAGLTPSTLNGLGLAYVGVRFVYNHIYIFQDLVPTQVRTLAFFASVGCYMALFVQAGWKWNEKRGLL